VRPKEVRGRSPGGDGNNAGSRHDQVAVTFVVDRGVGMYVFRFRPRD